MKIREPSDIIKSVKCQTRCETSRRGSADLGSLRHALVGLSSSCNKGLIVYYFAKDCSQGKMFGCRYHVTASLMAVVCTVIAYLNANHLQSAMVDSLS